MEFLDRDDKTLKYWTIHDEDRWSLVKFFRLNEEVSQIVMDVLGLVIKYCKYAFCFPKNFKWNKANFLLTKWNEATFKSWENAENVLTKKTKIVIALLQVNGETIYSRKGAVKQFRDSGNEISLLLARSIPVN